MAPIPPLAQNGVLPPGAYDCTMEEMETAFGYNDRRRAIIEGLKATLGELPERKAVDHVIVDGSFVEAKRDPADLDAVIVVRNMGDGSDGTKVLSWVAQRQKVLKAERLCHLFVSDEHAAADWADFFGRRRDGTAKGTLRVRGDAL